MKVNELMQRVVRDALDSGEYSVGDVRENVDVAVESYEQEQEEGPELMGPVGGH